MEEQPKNNGNGAVEDDDSDMVVFGDEENSPQLEIIDVKKRQKTVQASDDGISESTKKRQKLE